MKSGKLLEVWTTDFLFIFKRSNEGLEVKNMIIAKVLAFLIRNLFTEINHFSKGSSKITIKG